MSIFVSNNFFLSTDNNQMTIIVKISGITSPEPAIVKGGFRRLVIIIVSNKVCLTQYENLLIFRNIYLCPRQWFPHCFRLYFIVRLNLKNTSGFCKTVALFQVQPYGSEKSYDIGAYRMSPGKGADHLRTPYPVHEWAENNNRRQPFHNFKIKGYFFLLGFKIDSLCPDFFTD